MENWETGTDMPNSIVFWEHQYRGDSNATTTVEAIEHFDARGMRFVYGRGDQFERRAFHLDIWRNSSNRLFARFWSQCNDVDRESHELFGVADTQKLAGPPFDVTWIPNCLRKHYDTWVLANS